MTKTTKLNKQGQSIAIEQRHNLLDKFVGILKGTTNLNSNKYLKIRKSEASLKRDIIDN